MVDCLTSEITHIVSRLFLLFSQRSLTILCLVNNSENAQTYDKMDWCSLQLFSICLVEVVLMTFAITRMINVTTYFQKEVGRLYIICRFTV
jgi:hypothetical protein